jgi:hypothetical protein
VERHARDPRPSVGGKKQRCSRHVVGLPDPPQGEGVRQLLALLGRCPGPGALILGEDAFVRLRGAAIAFNRRLSRDLGAAELGELERVLGLLVANVAGEDRDRAPWAGQIERPALT